MHYAELCFGLSALLTLLHVATAIDCSHLVNGQSCGTVCCDYFEYCADAKTSTCCFEGETVKTDPSGYSHICCGANQYNGGGICCNEGTNFCLGSCCPGNCEYNPKGFPIGICKPTAAGCVAAGGTGALCPGNTGCKGTTYCSGGCCYVNHIIPREE